MGQRGKYLTPSMYGSCLTHKRFDNYCIYRKGLCFGLETLEGVTPFDKLCLVKGVKGPVSDLLEQLCQALHLRPYENNLIFFLLDLTEVSTPISKNWNKPYYFSLRRYVNGTKKQKFRMTFTLTPYIK